MTSISAVRIHTNTNLNTVTNMILHNQSKLMETATKCKMEPPAFPFPGTHFPIIVTHGRKTAILHGHWKTDITTLQKKLRFRDTRLLSNIQRSNID